MGRLQYIGRYVIDGRPLGKGNFATVELATHSITRSKVAIKVIDVKKIKEDYVQQNLLREARILAQVRHPNIIRLYETIRSSALYCLVTEFAGGGQLLEFVRGHKDGRLTEKAARPFVRQLVSALHHLHERGIVHRDLKMENIILDEKKKNIKIVDFGLSNTFRPDALLQTHCGSPEYAAPELFVMGTKYGSEVDIWSLGVNMYAMVVGKLPFTTPFTEPNRRQKLLQQIQYGLTNTHGKDMTHLSQECCDLLHLCVEPNPDLRIAILDIEVHPWLTEKGKVEFYPYQPPPKDQEMRKKIIKRMSEMLKVPLDRIESNVHEFRCDDVSAMYNLLMDEQLKSRGLWELDHTIKRDYKKQSQEAQKNDGNNNKIKEQVKVAAKKTAPTPVMLTKPSLYDPDYQKGKKGKFYVDFELSSVRPGSSKYGKGIFRIRPKMSTMSSSKTKPFGNATTANSIQGRAHQGTDNSKYMALSKPVTPKVETHVENFTTDAKTEPTNENKESTTKLTNQNHDNSSSEALTNQCQETESTWPITTVDDRIKSAKKEEGIPKLSIVNMEDFLEEGFKLRTSVKSSVGSRAESPCGTPLSGNTRSRHFEEVLKRYMVAEETKLKEKDSEKKELLEEIMKQDVQSENGSAEDEDGITEKDAGKYEAVDSGNDCGNDTLQEEEEEEEKDEGECDVDESEERHEVKEDDAETKDERSVMTSDLKDVSSEYCSDSGKENRIVKWVQSTQVDSALDQSGSTTPEVLRKIFKTPLSVQSRDMFPSRQSHKSTQSRSSVRAAPKPTPWKQQYNVTKTTTVPEPSIRESLKQNGSSIGRGFQGSMYSPRPEMRKLHAGRTPIRGERVHQQVPDENIVLYSSTPTSLSRADTPDTYAWTDQSDKTYKLPPNSPRKHKSAVATVKGTDNTMKKKGDQKMEKYTGPHSAPAKRDFGKYKKDNFPKERSKNNVQVRIYTMIKEEETRQKRQLVLLHQQEYQRKQQQQKLIQQQEWHRQQQQILQRKMEQLQRRQNQSVGKKTSFILPKRSVPSFSVRKEDNVSSRAKSAGVFEGLRKDKPVAVVTPRTIRTRPEQCSLAIITKPAPIIKTVRNQEPVFDVLDSQNVKAVRFPTETKNKRIGWSKSSEKVGDWDASYRLQRQVSSILKRGSHMTQLRTTPTLRTYRSSLPVK